MVKRKTGDVQVLTAHEVAPKDTSIELFITKAIENNSPIETMERLLVMRRELKAERAKEAFVEALSKFQGECPIVVKDKEVLNKNSTTVRYKYAPLDSIVRQVGTFLTQNGLSYTTETIDNNDGYLTAICKITHVLGHSESSSFRVPIDKEGFMSAPQKYASALTFAKRYAFCGALGILTGDEDTDANIEEESTTSKVSVKEYGERMQKCKNLEELKSVWFTVPRSMQDELGELKEFLKSEFSSYENTTV